MKVNDKVIFKASVVRQCGHSSTVASMRGLVLAINGKVAEVDCLGTYDNEEGKRIRFIPLANLCAFSDNLGIFPDIS